jgi:hypothetical protein
VLMPERSSVVRILLPSLRPASRPASWHWALRSLRALMLLMLALAALPGLNAAPSIASAPARYPAEATTARAMPINLRTSLSLIGRPGRVINEKGPCSGTFSGQVYTHFTAVATYSGVATLTIYPSSGGSINGRATTRGYIVGAVINVTGTMSITGGTGRWAHASAHGLRFRGSVNRQNLHAITYMSGSINT